MAAPKKSLEDKFSVLVSIPADKLQVINDLIFKENKITRAVYVLQNDFGLFLNYTPNTLRIYLHKYKKQFKNTWHQFNLDSAVHPSQAIPEELKKNLPAHVGDPKLAQWVPYGRVKVLLGEAVMKFDAMQELERVAMMQYDRVMKLIHYEEQLPIEEITEKGKKVSLVGLEKGTKMELESLHTMLKNIVTLQMDLGIRHKVEQAQNHLHVNLEPHQQKLMKDFQQMQVITEITTQALEVITGKSRTGEKTISQKPNN